ncbi:MAG: hypothetical protein IM445_09960 [Microcystis sp. M015S1]|jgi:hypothetical protein|nr:hypothetical protein [Microcystis sp. M015S1]
MKISRLLFIIINLLGIIFPFLFPLATPGTKAYFSPIFSWPIFIFCIWASYKGKIKFIDDSNQSWNLNIENDPSRFWFAIGMTALSGWLIMMAIRGGSTMIG